MPLTVTLTLSTAIAEEKPVKVRSNRAWRAMNFVVNACRMGSFSQLRTAQSSLRVTLGLSRKILKIDT